MLFTSLEFLLLLPLAVLLFWVLPARFRLVWLMLASLVFYGSFGLQNLGYPCHRRGIDVWGGRGHGTVASGLGQDGLH